MADRIYLNDINNGIITCPFCGQTQAADKAYSTELEAKEAAAMLCKCPLAKAHQYQVKLEKARKENLRRIAEQIKKLRAYCVARQADLAKEVEDLITSSALFIIDGIIEKLAFSFGLFTVRVSVSDEKIKLNVTYKDTEKIETSQAPTPMPEA